MLGMPWRVLQLSQLRMHSKRRGFWTTLMRGALALPLEPITNSKPLSILQVRGAIESVKGAES